MRWCAVLLGLAFLLTSAISHAQLSVSEVMYDPASDESRWEWIEVRNTGSVAIDLNGYVIDRVGDSEMKTVTPSILSKPFFESTLVNNPTVIPSGGIAVLYNGPGLGYDPGRFRAAWPQMPVGTTLIGVENWYSLTNSPTVSKYAPSLPAMTVGLWANETKYRLDAANFGTPTAPDKRMYRTTNAAAAFGYDDNEPWRDTLGKSAIHYMSGPIFSPSSWGRSNAGIGGASASVMTFLHEPINADDYGSPGIIPTGKPSKTGLLITEVMYNPASTAGGANEWEWIEVYNSGPTINFTTSPHWLDDDDDDPLSTANITTGSIASGSVGVLFNSSAANLTRMREAWDRPGQTPINLIAVSNWPTLNNTGDTIGLWNKSASYSSDHADETPTFQRAVTSFTYSGSAPWPLSTDGEAIRLTSLGSNPADPLAWARARGANPDPNAYQSADVFVSAGVIDNAGGDSGSPGYHWPDIYPPLPGDYNRDGRVDSADYTVWRDRKPLPTETATAGVTDAADYAVWRASYGLKGKSGAAVAIPEPASAMLLFAALACGGCRSRLRWVVYDRPD